jgi:hypothetical protein
MRRWRLGREIVAIHLKGASQHGAAADRGATDRGQHRRRRAHGHDGAAECAAEAAGGLYTRGTGAGQINQDANGRVDVNGKAWAGGAIPAPNVTGVPLVDDKYLLGTIYSTPATAGIQDINLKNIANAAVSTSTAQLGVNAVNVGGTAQTGRDIGASVLLSSGTGTGQLDFTSGVVKANLAQILGTALTETAGLLAGGFKKFFNVATPAATMDHGVLVDTVTTYTGNTPQTGDAFARLGAPAGASVSADVAAAKVDTAAIKTKTDFLPSATAGAAGGVFIAGTNAATVVTTSFTTTFTGNLSGSVGSVSGAVGSVAGNVGGNVTGSVGSVTGLTASNLDATVSSRLASSSYTAPPSASTIAQAVWDALTSALTTIGSIGKLLVTDIDATISSRSSGGSAPTASAIADEVQTRTIAAVTTVNGLAANSVTAAALAADAGTEIGTAVWATTTRLLSAGTNIVLAKGTGVTGFNDLSAAQVNAEADTALADVGVTTTVTGRIDAAITSRLASGSYTAPDNSGITAIKAKTDKRAIRPTKA